MGHIPETFPCHQDRIHWKIHLSNRRWAVQCGGEAPEPRVGHGGPIDGHHDRKSSGARGREGEPA
jgi:hypothetical protein